MDFPDLLKQMEEQSKKALDHLRQEFVNIRTGRASTAMVENVLVESYGTKSPLKAISSISTPDATTIMIQPWDKNIIPNIEKAFLNSSLGLNAVSDGNVLRINIPKPTEEKRKELVKVISEKSEESKVTLRNERQNVHQNIKDMKQESEITEDDFYKYEKELQDVYEKYVKDVDEMTAEKERELMTI